MQQKAKDTLTKYKLRKTDCRLAVLQIFLEKDFAIGQAEIEEEIGENFDRVTIYRTLKKFKEVGIIHKVLDNSGVLKYAICSVNCKNNEYQHEHVHFKCQVCGNTNCLTDLEIPVILLPKGYESKEANLLIQGVCPDCN